MFIHVFFVIVALLNLIKRFEAMSIDEAIRTIECKSPTDVDLREKFLEESKYEMDNIVNGTIYYPVAKARLNIAPNSHEVSIIGTQDPKNCTRLAQLRRDGYISPCPHHFVTEYRADRYPHVVHKAVCNCEQSLTRNEINVLADSLIKMCKTLESCNIESITAKLRTLLNPSRYICKPVSVLRIVLVKGDCEEGLIQWKPAIERIDIGCASVEAINPSRI